MQAIVETLFDICYLVTVLTVGIRMSYISTARSVAWAATAISCSLTSPRTYACSPMTTCILSTDIQSSSARRLRRAPTPTFSSSTSLRNARLVRYVVEHTEATGEVGMTPEVWRSMMALRSFLFANIYSKGEAKREEPKASRLLEELFSHFCAHLDEVPGEYRLHDADAPEVQVADFVAGMTDRYAIKTYEEIFVPRVWSVS